MKDDGLREKRWRFLYLRSDKLHRAKQFGTDYPRISQRQKIEREDKSIRGVLKMSLAPQSIAIVGIVFSRKLANQSIAKILF